MAEPNFNYPGEGITSSVQDGKTYDFTGVYTDGVTYYISKAAIESRNDGGEITDWDVSTPYGGEYSIEDSYIAYSPEGFMAGWETVAFDLTVENADGTDSAAVGVDQLSTGEAIGTSVPHFYDDMGQPGNQAVFTGDASADTIKLYESDILGKVIGDKDADTISVTLDAGSGVGGAVSEGSDADGDYFEMAVAENAQATWDKVAFNVDVHSQSSGYQGANAPVATSSDQVVIDLQRADGSGGTDVAPDVTNSTSESAIDERGTYRLSTADLNVDDSDTSNTNITYVVTDTTGGQLEWVGSVDQAWEFTQSAIEEGWIRFNQTGGSEASFDFRVSDDSTTLDTKTFNFSSVNEQPLTEMVNLTTSDRGKTMASQDDFGTTMTVNNFVDGESHIDVSEFFTSLGAGWKGSEDATTLSSGNAIGYQSYGDDTLVFVNLTASVDITEDTDDDDPTNEDITLRLDNVQGVSESDFIGLPELNEFTNEVDTWEGSEYTDVVKVTDGSKVDGLDLFSFGQGDDILWLNNAGTTTLQSGNISGLETAFVNGGANTVEVYDAFLDANNNNLNLETSETASDVDQDDDDNTDNEQVDPDESNTLIDTSNVSGTNTVTLTGTAIADLQDGVDNTLTIGDISGDNDTSYVFGGNQVDTITGGDRADTIYGLAGQDDLSGGAGQDVLVGGAATDTLTGGTEQDEFKYLAESESDGQDSFDKVQDFTWSVDKVNLNKISDISNGFKSTKKANSVWTQQDGDDVIVYVNSAGVDWSAEGDEEMKIRLVTPEDQGGNLKSADQFNFLDFIGVTPFTDLQDDPVGRTSDDTFTVSIVDTFDPTDAGQDDTVDGDSGFDTLQFKTAAATGTFSLASSDVTSIEKVDFNTLTGSVTLTLADSFLTASQGVDGESGTSDDDKVVVDVAGLGGQSFTLDTTDASNGDVLLANGSTNITLADSSAGNKNLYVQEGEFATITLSADAGGTSVDEFTGGSDDDTVRTTAANLNGDVLDGRASDADDEAVDTGDTLQFTNVASDVSTDDLASVTNFETFQIDNNDSGSTKTITLNDANVGNGDTLMVNTDGDGITNQTDVNATNETDGYVAFDLVDAGQNVTADVNVENYDGGSATSYQGGDDGNAHILDMHTDADVALTASDMANIVDVDEIDLTGNYNWDIALSGNEVDGQNNDTSLTIDANNGGNGLTSMDLSVDARNEQDEDTIAFSGATNGDVYKYSVDDGSGAVTYTYTAASSGASATSVAEGIAAAIGTQNNYKATSTDATVTVTATHGSDITVAEQLDDGGDGAANNPNTSLTLNGNGSGKMDYMVNQYHIAQGLTASGGSGTNDSLTVYGEGNLTLGANVTAIENLILTEDASTTVTLADANMQGHAFTVDGTALSSSSSALTVNATAETTVAGNDQLNIDGGSGDDVFKYGNNLLDKNPSIIDGGGGDDTIQITDPAGDTSLDGVTKANLANVTGVETIATNADKSMDNAIVLNDNNMDSGAITVDASSITTEGRNVLVDASNEDDSAVTVKVDDTQFGSTDGDVVTGGTSDQMDTLIFDSDGAVSASTNTDGITKIEKVDIQGNYAHNFTTQDATIASGENLIISATDVRTQENDLTLNANNETDGTVTMQVDAGIRDTMSVSITGSPSDAGDKTVVTINDTTVTYTGTAADATTLASNLKSAINVDGTYTAWSNSAELFIEGGEDGEDLSVSTSFNDDTTTSDNVTFSNNTNIVEITATGSMSDAADEAGVVINGTSITFTNSAADATAIAQGVETAINNDGTYSAYTDAAQLFIEGADDASELKVSSFINDAATGDTYSLTNGTYSLGGETLTGGSGNDTLELSSSGSDIHVEAADAAGITKIETVKFTTSDVDVDFTHNNGSADSSTGTMTYEARDLTSGSLTFDGSNEDSDSLNIFGGDANDVLAGGQKDDVIRGGLGNDTLTGGGGSSDSDRFVFNEEDFQGGTDTVTDYNTNDEIYLEIAGAVDFNSDNMEWRSTSEFLSGSEYEDVTQVRKEDVTDGTKVQFDNDGDGSLNFEVLLQGTDVTTITTSSFVFG